MQTCLAKVNKTSYYLFSWQEWVKIFELDFLTFNIWTCQLWHILMKKEGFLRDTKNHFICKNELVEHDRVMLIYLIWGLDSILSLPLCCHLMFPAAISLLTAPHFAFYPLTFHHLSPCVQYFCLIFLCHNCT